MSTYSSLSSPHTSDDVFRAILRTQWQGVRALVIQAPPGSGKTQIVVYAAIQEMVHLHGRAMVVTQTNEQAFDLAYRLATMYRLYPIHLLVRKDLSVPSKLLTLNNIHIVREAKSLPSGPCIVVANVVRWSYDQDKITALFTCQIIDEAYQLPDFRFRQIVNMAHRFILVGDPGQIDPVIVEPVGRWQSNPAGPHIACPKALFARHPSLQQITLPASHRLVADSVALIQPTFYPTLQFISLTPPGTRRLCTMHPGNTALDQAIHLVENEASIVELELPAQIVGDCDMQVVEVIVDLVTRLLDRGSMVKDIGGSWIPLSPSMIGVVCANIDQVSAVGKRLSSKYPNLLVETAERFQGLERSVMVVYAPLSGHLSADAFHLDAGRLCVMLTRHRLTCFIVTRAGEEDLLHQHMMGTNRVLGLDEDSDYVGWRAHFSVLSWLRQQRRIVRI